MEVLIGQTCVHLKDVNLGKSFSDMRADLRIDQGGRVKAYHGFTLFFYTDLNYLPLEILMAASEGLGLKARRGLVARIHARITAILEAQVLDTSSE